MTRTTPRLGRRPGESGAREAILAAARALFAELGFERATIRAIARRAEVDPALVHHYFGTKDDLLVAALQLPVDPATILAGVADQPSTGVAIVRRVLGLWDDPALRPSLLALLRTAVSHERAATVLREVFQRTLLAHIGAIARPDDPARRAALAVSHVAGLLIARHVFRVPPLATEPPERVAATVGPVLDHYLTGDLGAPVTPPGPR